MSSLACLCRERVDGVGVKERPKQAVDGIVY